MYNKNLILFLRYAAVAGNIVFALWIMFNAMNEGFRGTIVEKFSAAGLICLLGLNSYLLLTGIKRGQLIDR